MAYLFESSMCPSANAKEIITSTEINKKIIIIMDMAFNIKVISLSYKNILKIHAIRANQVKGD
jgi:hypothetical protein